MKKSARPSLKQQLIDLFSARPGLEAHVRDCGRQLGHSAGAVGRALRALEAEGRLQSRWVGRSRVYRARPRRPMSPTAQTDTRPYFLWDLDLSWSEFGILLKSPDPATRRWSMERLLNNARWSDIWSLVTPEEVRAELPFLNVRFKAVYAEVVNAAARR
ncbi:MAG: hypothetical protein ACR2MY_04900 [Candidatus Dormibacteria bacterium]